MERAIAERTATLPSRIRCVHESNYVDSKLQAPVCGNQQGKGDHGHLKHTPVKVPPFATFAVPFAWMLRSEQRSIDERLPNALPPDEESPFSNSPWVFGRARQEAILDLLSSRLTPERSLVFFYCKEGQPLGDTISRLVVGVGRITSLASPIAFDVRDETKPKQLMWGSSVSPFNSSRRSRWLSTSLSRIHYTNR